MEKTLELLKNITPFNLISTDVLKGIVDVLQPISFYKEEILYKQGASKMRGLDIIVDGSYETFFYDSAANKRVIQIYPAGTCYGGISVLLNRKKSLKTVLVTKNTRIYFLHRKYFKELCQSNESFFQYFITEFGKKMLDDEFAHFFKKPSDFDESFIAAEQLYSRKIESIEFRELVFCNHYTPAYEAAKIMALAKVSCLFVKNSEEKIIGYVTDITLRDKIVAKQADASQNIENFLDNPTIQINTQAYVYEALLMMFRTKTRYLLVEKNGEYIGFLSRNKLLSEQAQSPLMFIQSVKLVNSFTELKRKWESVAPLVYQLLNRGVYAEIVNQVITTIADTITQKIIEKVIEKLGTPPAKFVFMVTGSEGRKELTLKTDQDNAIIYEDKANEQREMVRAYFLNFATLISEHLDYVGIVFCSGGFMAQNPEWCHSLSHWKNNYKSWMDVSLPETAIKFSTFFDCRLVYGEPAIMDELREFLDLELQKPLHKFYVYIAKNALQYEPPLTFFNNIRTKTIGTQEVFDIKKAMTPVVDLVRVYALQNRIFVENTGERLKALKTLNIFTEKQYNDLHQCYYFLMSMRLKNQAKQIIQDKNVPDNLINTNNLTKIELATLKEIFKTIVDFQAGIRMNFTGNL
ncbi:MAG: CBS domain-containing protein [Sphingobacteriales bacterium]|nr:MAG: CBS domain-containing protein [Sphingobacteriales bacterium]